MTEGGAAWTDVYAAELAAGAADAGETGLVLAARHLIPGAMAGMVVVSSADRPITST